MTIYRGSRYEYADIDYYDYRYSESVYPCLFYSFDVINTMTYYEYVWKEGDRLDKLADTFYKKPTLWWVIPEHNPQIEDPAEILPGTVLRIPSVT